VKIVGWQKNLVVWRKLLPTFSNDGIYVFSK